MASEAGRVGRLTVVAAVLFSGCASRSGSEPSRVASRVAEGVSTACRYELAESPRSLISVVQGRIPSLEVAAAGATRLAVHQWSDQQTHTIRGRLLGPDGATKELLLSPPDGIHVTPEIIVEDGRFFVWWQRQSPDGALGRWVEPDGTLGPTFEIPLPRNLGVSLATTKTGFSAVYVDGREGVDTLHRQLFDRALVPTGAPLAIDDASSFDGRSIGQLVRPNGEIWTTAVGTGRRRATAQVHLIRMSASGQVLGPVLELSETEVEAARVSLLSVPGGVLAAWLEEPQIAQGPGMLWTRKLDDGGAPLGPPAKIGSGATRWDGLALVSDRGAPLLVADGGRSFRLDAGGAAASEKSEPIPVEVRASFWLGTTPSPSLAWVEPRGDEPGAERGELLFAVARCASSPPSSR